MRFDNFFEIQILLCYEYKQNEHVWTETMRWHVPWSGIEANYLLGFAI